MRQRTKILVLFAITGAVACGGASTTDFSTAGGAGKASGGTGASGAQGGTGGSGNDTSTGGTNATGGSDATGGSSATGGSDATGGSSATGGSDATGGTSGTGGDATGGTAGDVMGGTGGAMGGTAGDVTGGTGGTPGGSAGMATGGVAGAMGGSAGAGGVDCAALEMDYSTTLQEAEACNPTSGKADQCSMTENDSLTCSGCMVYVNPANQAAIMHLDELRKQAGTHCVTPCPAIACVVPPTATCQPSGTGKNATGSCAGITTLPH